MDAGGFTTADRPFFVDQDERALRLREALDFEASSHHRLTLELEDSAGAKVQATFNITVLNVNEPPAVTDDQSYDVDENEGAPVVLGSVAATDPDGATDVAGLTFAIDAS